MYKNMIFIYLPITYRLLFQELFKRVTVIKRSPKPLKLHLLSYYFSTIYLIRLMETEIKD